MKAIRNLLLLKSILFFVLSASSSNRIDGVEGFVKINSEKELFVDWTYAQKGKPTVVLINGLTYSTLQWKPFAEALIKKGFGVLKFDPHGMGQTLLKYGYVSENISYKTQTSDLRDLLRALKITSPVNLIGLSYGGGLAIAFAAEYPNLVDKVIALAPYTEPVASQEQWVQSQVWLTRKTVPWNPASDEQLYEFFFRQMVYLSYPMVEPIVLENPYKLEAIFRMALGIRPLLAKDIINQLPNQSLHLVIAGSDQYIPREVLENFWQATGTPVRATKTIINNVEHKIPEAAPQFLAHYVEAIMTKNAIMNEGREFQADPVTGLVQYDGGSFQLPKGK